MEPTLTSEDILKIFNDSKDVPPKPKPVKPVIKPAHEILAEQELADLKARIEYQRSPEGRRAAIMQRLRNL